VVRNNIELMRKIQQKNGGAPSDKQADIIDRIDRASLTMQHLSETLLWLSREDNRSLSTEPFDLASLIRELVGDMRYLLNNKPVEIELDTSPYTLTQSQVAARIVVGNLIRNAFQHTWEGTVVIRQSGNDIAIDNDCLTGSDTDSSGDQGFGLGLQLTRQLCDKLGWTYDTDVKPDRHQVTLTIAPLTSA
jgi:signal transduction histidine kinase